MALTKDDLGQMQGMMDGLEERLGSKFETKLETALEKTKKDIIFDITDVIHVSLEMIGKDHFEFRRRLTALERAKP